MERLELAIRRYAQIVPRAVAHPDLPFHDLEIWLDEYVCPALEDYSRRPLFRENATWSVRTLRHGADSDERQLIDEVDSQLVAFARAVLILARNKRIADKLVELFPIERFVAAEAVLISGSGTKTIERENSEVPVIPRLISQIESIATRPWPDLVNVDDYFEPQQEWSRTEEGGYIQRGEWIVSLNADLLPVGNFVVRCLLKRVQIKVDVLSDFWLKCRRSLNLIRTPYKSAVGSAELCWASLSNSSTRLRAMLKSGRDNRIRDACVAAVQVYAAYHLRPDLDWLGLGPASISNRQAPLRARLSGLQNPHAFDRIAASLRDLTQLYEEGLPKQSEIDEAIANGGLVILQSKKEAYWATVRISIGLKGRCWDLLNALARKGRHGAVVELNDVFGEKVVGTTTMSSTWNRLKPLLPPALRKLIKPGHKPGTYVLTLPPHQIHVFS